jgi:DNA-binding NtrC family response regulator
MVRADTGLYRLLPASHTDAGRYRVDVLCGPDAGRGIAFGVDPVVVGTHATADLRLADPTVSRRHLELAPVDAGLRVTDLGSTNGTYLGGARVGTVVVGAAVRLRLGGGTELDVAPATGGAAAAEPARLGDLSTRAPAMRALFQRLAQVAQTDATLLLCGETGTGKERVARAIHALSKRRGGPFVVVDCAALPRELIASELFGHCRGAFTGAQADQPGLVEQAADGTLMLDEIGELPLELQPHLLRLLENRQVRRLGDGRARAIDLRVIAATHRDLPAMVRRGEFREDLYFRLAVVRAVLPPLRERREDIRDLARDFLARLGRDQAGLPHQLEAQLFAYGWPGNVRELRNVVESALYDQAFELPTPPGETTLELPFKQAKGRLVESFERAYLSELLARHHGNISRAAHAAGIDRNYIHRLVRKYGLDVARG